MKTIVIISNYYPYYIGEDWMYKELKEATKYFDKIFLLPVEKLGNDTRWIPDNCILSDVLVRKEFSFRKFRLKINLKILLLELFRSGKWFYILKNLKSFLRTTYYCQARAEILFDFLKENEITDAHFYAVWMSDAATILSILKDQRKINNMVFRLHGYDLFDERREGGYMPFRNFNFKNADKVFVLSETGTKYLQSKKVFPEKLITNYSGLYNNGTSPFDPNAIFTIVSCSNMFKFKRVKLIVEALSKIDFRCAWHHFGSGDEFPEVEELASKLPSNIEVKLHGRVSNEAVLNFYKSNSVNLFIHLSETEGLGMAIVEAQSFGIPAIATNAGGVKEVVNENTGILLQLSAGIDEVVSCIRGFRESEKNTIEFRKKVKEAFELKFGAEINYRFFFEEILKIKA